MSQVPTSGRTEARPPSPLAGFLSYLVPGLGQIYLGQVGKGLMFFACLLAMFFYGQMLGDWRNVYLPDMARGGDDPIPWQNNPWRIPRPALPLANIIHHRWHFAGQFWIGIAAWPAIWQYNRGHVLFDEPPTFWDTFQRAPSEPELNDYLVKRDKLPDLAWVYTVIAGMLNILVIYDAFAGPAYGSGAALEPRRHVPPPEPAGV